MPLARHDAHRSSLLPSAATSTYRDTHQYGITVQVCVSKFMAFHDRQYNMGHVGGTDDEANCTMKYGMLSARSVTTSWMFYHAVGGVHAFTGPTIAPALLQ